MYDLEIKFYQTDPDAKNAILSVDSTVAQPWSELDDLTVDNKPEAVYFPTLEWNHTILDGSLPEFPDNTDGYTWGFYSGQMSGGDGIFDSVPELIISFSESQKSKGLTCYLYMDSDITVRVSWYSDSEGDYLIKTGTYNITPPLGDIRETVSGYKRVKLEFLSTVIPFRYVKLFNLDYGIIRVLADEEINKCQIIEEIDPTSESISINTVSLNIRTRNSFISPITSPDFDDMLMEKQLLKIFRNKEPFGTFFLESWEDVYQDGIEFDMQAGDAMSILDLYPHNGGIYFNTPVSEILDEIFEICFPTKTVLYILDPAYQESTVTGWVPIGTCGLTFQHICFALNATADTARIGHIRIFPRETDIKSDSMPESSDKQPFIDISDLRAYKPPHYTPTLEPNYTLLDGGVGEFPDDTTTLNLGWESLSMSNENGVFETPPTVNIPFRTSHNLKQITLIFGAYEREYISKLRLTLFDEFDNEIFQKLYEFSSNPGVIDDWVYGYRRMLIEALETSAPHRYAKIAFIDYGKSYYIPLERQYRKGRDRPTDFISGVRVVSHRFTAVADEIEIHNDILPNGLNRIEFPEPLHGLIVTGGEIVESHANYTVVNVTSSVNVVITGKRYVDNKRIHAVNAVSDVGRIEKVRTYENYTLISPEIGDTRAQELFDHLRLPINSETDIVLEDTQVGHMVQVDTRGNPVIGVVKRLDINLRANRADMEVIGSVASPDL